MFFVRAHYAEFDKTMRHENSIGQDIHTKKKLRYFFAPLSALFLIDLKIVLGYRCASALLGQQLTWKKRQ